MTQEGQESDNPDKAVVIVLGAGNKMYGTYVVKGEQYGKPKWVNKEIAHILCWDMWIEV